jgi:hypothetical protein
LIAAEKGKESITPGGHVLEPPARGQGKVYPTADWPLPQNAEKFGAPTHGLLIPTKLPSCSRASAHRNAPTSGLSK